MHSNSSSIIMHQNTHGKQSCFLKPNTPSLKRFHDRRNRLTMLLVLECINLLGLLSHERWGRNTSTTSQKRTNSTLKHSRSSEVAILVAHRDIDTQISLAATVKRLHRKLNARHTKASMYDVTTECRADRTDAAHTLMAGAHRDEPTLGSSSTIAACTPK